MSRTKIENQPKPPFPEQPIEPPGLESRMDPEPRYEAPLYRGSDKLLDQVAIVTGGDSGIGRAVAVLFAREGADVAIVHLAEEEEDARETIRSIEKEGRRGISIPGDVSSFEFCKRAVERTVSELGRLDILVNNAAYQNHVDSFDDLSLEQWDHTFRVNIYGYFYMSKAAVPHMRDGGAIVNCGSIAGMRGSKGLVDYSATKGAIHAFSKSLAQSLLDRGIRVNCVAPGPVWTPL
ncbi:MAG TPA: SDR family NAD(P)-dependent oxidoreductase, partial [Planctomycetota bacterium]|nr:SDR family NAD(P)-dependent oxidoreductase [Planctomycetota bacterium]